MINEKELIKRIKEHKKNVVCDNAFINSIYGMAHDHIIELVEILVEKGGAEG